MKKHKLWFGFLEAGSKSSPVVIDRSMEMGDGNTLLIYNHNKKEVLKYVRELVEPKLRELTAQEKKLEASLKKGFSESLKTIKFNIPKALNIPEKEIPKPTNDTIPEVAELDVKELDDDADDDDVDDDWKDSDD